MRNGKFLPRRLERHSTYPPQVMFYKTKIHSADIEVKQRYEDVRQHSLPDGDTCRRVDTCDAVSRQILKRLCSLLDDGMNQDLHTRQAPWTKTGYVFSSVESQRSILSHQGSSSEHE